MGNYWQWSVALMAVLSWEMGASLYKQPNIILLLSDDVGFGDYQEQDPEMATPALTALAQRGLTLNQSYSLHTCTPTRSALLSGKYPYKIGMQAGKIHGATLRWLNTSVKLLPEVLKELNYSTHAVGKWHLGFCNWNLTPRFRGFDTFFGLFTGAGGYFNHSGSVNGTYDFRDNGRVAFEYAGQYSTELYTKRVQKIIRARKSNPFFIYMAYQTAHSPFEAKQRYIDKYCSHVKDDQRRTHCAMVAALDESVRNITNTLDNEGIARHTIVLYLSDNGGPTGDGSINYPLRGGKDTTWEGGMRSHTIFVYPWYLQTVNATWDSLVHAVDWFPTLVKAAGGNASKIIQDLNLDGYDNLYKMRKMRVTNRRRMVYNIDDLRNRSAVRRGDLKLLKGKPASEKRLGWLPPPSLIAQNVTEEKVKASSIPDWLLFNVREDPEERNNLIDDPSYANDIRILKKFLEDEEKNLVPFPKKLEKNKAGLPQFYGGIRSPGWCCPT